MGLLSDLLGKKAGSAVKDLLNDAEKKIKDAVKDGVKDGIFDGVKDETGLDLNKAEEKAEAVAAAVQEAAEERSDALWGEIMPKDENQFSFKGTYRQYFEGIFKEEFPEYSFMLTHPQYYDSDVYSFTKGGEKKLVIELMQKKCDARKLRRDTQREGIPYLRFYTDCSDQGWWNARSYVIGKMRGALSR